MKIAIVGAGIIGITTAYELALQGHQVTVYEQHGAAAVEASFATAGVIAPGHIAPWASPGMPGQVLGHLLRRHAPVTLGWPLSGRELGWMWAWWRACKPEVYRANRARMQRLALYSRARLHQITADLQLSYDRSDGQLVLLRSAKDHALAQPGLQSLRDAGIRFQELDAAAARRIEPALSTDTAFAGAIHLPDDEVGNCRQFALLLKNEAQRLGVNFQFGTTVARIAPAKPPTLQLVGDATPRTFDAIVLCAGLASARLLQPLGLKLPLIGVRGYSVSAHIREPLNAPRSAVMDEHYKIAITRLGLRVRVSGSAELGGSATEVRKPALQTLYKVLHDWFPGAAQHSSGVQEWKGVRPMLPDGPPLLGASGLPGLWLNLGHGASGWALGCGSAQALADLIAGRQPDVDLEGLGIERLRR